MTNIQKVCKAFIDQQAFEIGGYRSTQSRLYKGEYIIALHEPYGHGNKYKISVYVTRKDNPSINPLNLLFKMTKAPLSLSIINKEIVLTNTKSGVEYPIDVMRFYSIMQLLKLVGAPIPIILPDKPLHRIVLPLP